MISFIHACQAVSAILQILDSNRNIEALIVGYVSLLLVVTAMGFVCICLRDGLGFGRCRIAIPTTWRGVSVIAHSLSTCLCNLSLFINQRYLLRDLDGLNSGLWLATTNKSYLPSLPTTSLFHAPIILVALHPSLTWVQIAITALITVTMFIISVAVNKDCEALLEIAYSMGIGCLVIYALRCDRTHSKPSQSSPLSMDDGGAVTESEVDCVKKIIANAAHDLKTVSMS